MHTEEQKITTRLPRSSHRVSSATDNDQVEEETTAPIISTVGGVSSSVFNNINTVNRCGMCEEPVHEDTDWSVCCPRCKCNFHLSCMEGSMFLSSRKEINCPICTEPGMTRASVIQRLEDLHPDQKRTWKRYWDNNCKQKFDLLKRHIMTKMKRSSTKDTFESEWKQWLQQKSKVDFLIDQKEPIRYDTLSSLGWSIPDIYHGITDSWKELCRLGFSLYHMRSDERIIIPLVLLYDVNVKTMRDTLGYHAVSINKVKGLTSTSLMALGYTTHTLCRMGLTKSRIPTFKKLKMTDWIRDLEFKPIHIKLMNIRESDFDTLLRPCKWNITAMEELMKTEAHGDEEQLGFINSMKQKHVKRHNSSSAKRNKKKLQQQAQKKDNLSSGGRGGGRGKTLGDYLSLDFDKPKESVAEVVSPRNRQFFGRGRGRHPSSFGHRNFNRRMPREGWDNMQTRNHFERYSPPSGYYRQDGMFIPSGYWVHPQHGMYTQSQPQHQYQRQYRTPHPKILKAMTLETKKQKHQETPEKSPIGKVEKIPKKGLVKHEPKSIPKPKLSKATFKVREPCYDKNEIETNEKPNIQNLESMADKMSKF